MKLEDTIASEQDRSRLRAEAEELPDETGVYCFLDETGQALYVGKARSIRRRVRSYFQRDLEPRLAAMMASARAIECVTTASEEEALLVENRLIKSRQPRFNVLLRDDKTYPYLKLTREPWPRVSVTRRLERDGAEYFGPYLPGGGARRTLRLVQRLSGVRVCELAIDGSLSRPCIYHDLGRCLGPCVRGLTSPEEYARGVERARQLLAGEIRALSRELRAEMAAAADALDFERAAQLRDLVGEIEELALGPKRWHSREGADVDLFGIAVHGSQAAISVLWIRSGTLADRRELFWEGSHELRPETVLAELLPQYYAGRIHLPDEIHLPFEVEGEDELAAWLSRRRPGRVRVLHPARGAALERLREAARDAERAFARRFRQGSLSRLALERLVAALGLQDTPRWIEGLDIAHSHGREPVCGVAVWRDGRMMGRENRAFGLGRNSSGDDFASLREGSRRRYERLLREGRGLPDLVLVDGGRSQLNAVVEALNELGEEVPCVALAKSDAALYLPSRPEPLRLDRSDPGLLLLERIRDETHRVANTRHRRRRGLRALQSALGQIDGVGPVRKRKLLQAFGSLEGVRRAGEAEVARVVGPAVARRVVAAVNDPEMR